MAGPVENPSFSAIATKMDTFLTPVVAMIAMIAIAKYIRGKMKGLLETRPVQMAWTMTVMAP